MERKALVGPMYDVGDMRVQISRPRVVAATSSGRCWFPDLLRFSTGELMLNHSVNADTSENQLNAQAVYLSTDGGETFPFAYDVNGFHNAGGEPRISLPDGRIVGTSTYLRADPPGQGRAFVAHRWTYDHGGRRYAVEPWGARIDGLPHDVLPYPKPSRTWWSQINWFSDIVPLEDGSWLSTISMSFAGDMLASTVAVISPDEGRSWEYRSTIAGPSDVPGASEGLDEPCLLRLDSGEILCISRVGDKGPEQLAKCHSSDEGRTWSSVDRLRAYSVAPQVCKLQNGVVLLGTGRPGLFLWCSADPRRDEWHPIDLIAHHNAMIEDWTMAPEKTTAYTAMVEIAPNRVFLVYDRIPFGGQPVPPDTGERSQIWLVEAEAQKR